MNLEKLWNAFCAHLGFRYYPVLGPVVEKGDKILPIPFLRQVQTHTCGFVAGLTAVRSFKRFSSEKFFEAVNPDQLWGTSTTRLIHAINSAGIKVAKVRSPSFSQVRNSLFASWPILATLKRSQGEEHWIVIVGIANNGMLFIAGNNAWCVEKMSWSQFKRLLGSNRVVLVIKGKK